MTSRVPPGYHDLAARRLLPAHVARAIQVSNTLPDHTPRPPVQDSRPPRLSREEYNAAGRPRRSRFRTNTPPDAPSCSLPDETTLYGYNTPRTLPAPF